MEHTYSCDRAYSSEPCLHPWSPGGPCPHPEQGELVYCVQVSPNLNIIPARRSESLLLLQMMPYHQDDASICWGAFHLGSPVFTPAGFLAVPEHAPVSPRMLPPGFILRRSPEVDRLVWYAVLQTEQAVEAQGRSAALESALTRIFSGLQPMKS